MQNQPVGSQGMWFSQLRTGIQLSAEKQKSPVVRARC